MFLDFFIKNLNRWIKNIKNNRSLKSIKWFIKKNRMFKIINNFRNKKDLLFRG